MTGTFEPGSCINNRYTIRSLLGAGGMGTVYLAFDSVLKLEVALKFSFTSKNRKDRANFLSREYDNLKLLNHCAIPKIFDLSKSEDGKNFFSMEFIKGANLSDLLKTNNLPDLTVRIGWLKQIVEALMHVHSKGIIYCDLKPDNILISSGLDNKTGTVKLLDFGISVSAKEDLRASDLEARGTTEYMSPEQHRGTKIDYRSDIYSFGVLAFEILTGERPFKSGQVDNEITKVLKYSAMHSVGKIPSAKAINKDIPEDLSLIIEVCLEKKREDRYQSSQELYECLSSADGSSVFTHLLRVFKAKIFGTPLEFDSL